jgi:hypothetical protein
MPIVIPSFKYAGTPLQSDELSSPKPQDSPIVAHAREYGDEGFPKQRIYTQKLLRQERWVYCKVNGGLNYAAVVGIRTNFDPKNHLSCLNRVLSAATPSA